MNSRRSQYWKSKYWFPNILNTTKAAQHARAGRLPLTTDTTCQLNVLRHDGDTVRMDSTQIGILEETNQVSLSSLLQSHDSRRLESQVGLEILSDFTDQPLERQLSNQQLSGSLVSSDFTKGNSSWSVSSWLLNTTCYWCGLSCTL